MRIDLLGRRLVRGPIGQHEGQRLAFLDGELRHRGHVLAADFGARAQDRHVGAGDGAQGVAVQPGHPGHGGAVAEAQHQLHAHGDFAGDAAHEANDVRSLSSRGHEVEHPHDAVRSLEQGLEDQGVLQVAAADVADLANRRDLPAAVALVAEQGGETGVGIESGPAQPVDRTFARDQGCGLAIADQGIVLDPHRHQTAPSNSTTTFTSSGWRVKASRQRASGTRREISRPSQPLSARARASAAAS